LQTKRVEFQDISTDRQVCSPAAPKMHTNYFMNDEETILPKHDEEALSAGEPLSMDKHSRNERLYKHLLQIGAFVEPVFSDVGLRRIDHLKVSSVALSH
jgi:hypothetical protein